MQIKANSRNPSHLARLSSKQMLGVVLLSALCVLLASCSAPLVGALSLAEAERQSGGPTLALVDNPELTVRVLESLLRSIVYSASAAELQASTNSVAQKRGLDLGISRGFSGSQAGKHLMGLSAASFANGPGRK